MAKTEKAAAPADRTIEDRIDELHKRRRSALQPGGRDAAQRQHDKGKLTARERLDILMTSGPSWRPTPSPSIAHTTSGWRSAGRPATERSRATARSTDGRASWRRRTSPG